MLDDYLPTKINSGPWVTAYSLNHLQALPAKTVFVLPICSLATPYEQLAGLGEFVLPPLYHEALTEDLRKKIVSKIIECFPHYGEDNSSRIDVVELSQEALPERDSPEVLAFSVDTAVEEHGPHLPLATDTIQSYSVLDALVQKFPQVEIGRPVEYGQLTWGLPFGFSIDVTAGLLREYVCNFCNSLMDWLNPRSLYVVDVHGSIVHRQAIVDGLNASCADRWLFRWLHEPLAEFASERGDQHAGGVETVLVERVSAELLDSNWWPNRIDEIASRQMAFETAVELAADLPQFCRSVLQKSLNGVIGEIKNAQSLDQDVLFDRMFTLASDDVQRLLSGESVGRQDAGQSLWVVKNQSSAG